MAHHCKATLVTCEDFRLHQRADGRNYIVDFVKNLQNDCDIITRGGGIQDLVRPQNDGFENSLLRDIGVSVNLHQVETIYLVNHEDCGAYGSINFSSREEELAQHYKDLEEARDIINAEFPSVAIKLFFAELATDSSDKFIFKEII
jgi:hypothetical protein